MGNMTGKKRVPGKSAAPVPEGRGETMTGKRPRPAADGPRDSQDIERAVYDGMQDLRVIKRRS